MDPTRPDRSRPRALLTLGLAVLATTALGGAAQEPTDAKARLEATRLELSKWIETQQLVSKERKDWQQGKEILGARVELLRKEVAAFE
ncbi:MAG: hypothetical protein EPO68_06000, partial [Planctomycetota bacterium]